MFLYSQDGAQPINSFALVSYIPEPLGSFLDGVRRELVPGCVPHAHVTILPPRPLEVSPDLAWSQIQNRIVDFSPFEIEPTGVEVFANTSVIYIAVGAGWRELQRVHDHLGSGCLEYDEPYSYHPHITLAQEIEPEQVQETFERARRLWDKYPQKLCFPLDTITFVQNTTDNRWIDLAHCTFGAARHINKR